MSNPNKCGDFVLRCVPEQFQHFFAVIGDNGEVDNEWWSFEIDEQDEDSTGFHVWQLLPEVCELLAWMPDASDEFVESIWKAAGDQCLTWVRG